MKWAEKVPYWLRPVAIWGKNIRRYWRGWVMVMVTWLNQPVNKAQARQLCEWMAPCPSCHRREAMVTVHDDGMLHQGEGVECGHCGHKGTVEVYGSEEVDVAWEEEDEPSA